MYANLIMRECVCLAFVATQKKTLIGGEKTLCVRIGQEKRIIPFCQVCAK